MNLKKIFFGIALLICAFSFSQNGINYKAVIKDDNGNILANDLIVVQFTIFIETGAIVYQESHTPTTDSNGLIIVNIGEGTVISGAYDAIDWGSFAHFLRVHMNTGSGLVDLGISEFKSVPYAKVAENVKGLEPIDEGNGMGWRLVGKDSDNYGDIGDNAIDFSVQNFASEVRGATGTRSVALGIGTEASGINSFAMGQDAVARANGSIALGLITEALGNYSLATGIGTSAEAYGSTAIGRFNLGGGNLTSWVGTDPLFEIGNGTNSLNRSNALTVYKNGFMRLNSSENGLIIYSDSQYGIYIPSGNQYGGYFEGTNAGIHAGAINIANPDISLGGEDGILSASSFSNSDLFLRSNDDVVIELDNDNTESGVFRIKDSNNLDVLTVNELGTLDMEGTLRIDGKSITDGGSDVLAFSSSLVPLVDSDDRLGGPNRRWQDVYAVNGAIQTSDRREKKNINNIDYGLKQVLQMQPVSFNWKNKNNPDTKLGLIAQDLQDLVPEVVHSHIWKKDETTGALTKKQLDRLGVYYSDLVPVLIKAIQEQQQIIETLNAKNGKQASKLENIEQNYKSLLSRIEGIESKSSN